MEFKSGFISIIGKPNVGKSTLINRLAGSKISIITKKPQTTRNAIKAIITTDKYQMIFIDTPGIMKPKNKLGEYMVKTALESLNEVDLILFMVEGTNLHPQNEDIEIINKLKEKKTPVFLLINKIDIAEKDRIFSLMSEYNRLMEFTDIIPISAATGEGLEILLHKIENVLPYGPKYYPDDIITDQPEKAIAAEIIREKFFMLLKQEIPYGIGVEITHFKEREGKNILDIEANIYCEKESQKGIVIGNNGKLIKKAGTLAREEIEYLFGIKVNLKLWVKTKNDWRNNVRMLKTLGYA